MWLYHLVQQHLEGKLKQSSSSCRCLNEHSVLQSGLVSIYPLTWFSDVLYPADLQDMLFTQSSPGVRLLLGSLCRSRQPATGIKQRWQQNRGKCVRAGLLPVSNKNIAPARLPPRNCCTSVRFPHWSTKSGQFSVKKPCSLL